MTSAEQPQRQCVSCGRPIGWDVAFCPHCGHDFRTARPGYTHLGQPVMQAPHPSKKNSTGLVIGIVVVVVVIVIALVAVSILSTSSQTGNPFVPTYHGTLFVKVTNDDWLNSHSYVVYVDDTQLTSDTLPANSYMSYTFSVSWQGSQVHTFQVVVASDNGSRSGSAAVLDGGSASVSISV